MYDSEKGQWAKLPTASEEGEGAIIDADEVEEDCAPLRIASDPGAPTAQDVEKHRAACHCPYRSWCEWCVQGRGVGEQHRTGPPCRSL